MSTRPATVVTGHLSGRGESMRRVSVANYGADIVVLEENMNLLPRLNALQKASERTTSL